MNQWTNFMTKKQKMKNKGKRKRIRQKTKEQFQQVTPKTPNRRVQKNHPSDQIIGNKDAGVETRRKIHSS